MSKDNLPLKTKSVVERYISGSFLKKIFYIVSILLTKYKIIYTENSNSSRAFIISFERHVRKDHDRMFFYLYKELLSELDIDYFKIKRVFDFSCLSPLRILNYAKLLNIYLIIEKQMDEIYIQFFRDRYKKVMVFCDVNPLMNFLCERFNFTSVETYSLQHGFYASPDNPIFENVYKTSNAKNFFVWDSSTKFWMEKFSNEDNRKLIKSGPIDFINLENEKKKKPFYFNRIKKIAIFSCGKDQLKKNEYLVGLYKYFSGLDELFNCEIVFICHPFFNYQDRVLFSKKYGIKFRSNRLKSENYDISFVLESSVWLELQGRGQRFFILDDFYTNNSSFEEVFSSVENGNNLDMPSSRVPFLRGRPVVRGILDEFR